MTLNRLIDVLTPENAYGLNQRIILSDAATREKSNLVWGVVYAIEFVSQVTPFKRTERVEVELAYEGTVTKRLYLTRPGYEHIGTESSTDAEFYGATDERLQLFSSKEQYKKFFLTLGQLRKDGRINDNEYMRVFQKLTRLAKSVPLPSISSAIQRMFGFDPRGKAIYEARDIAQSDPLITIILSAAGMKVL